jgi:hypothetical protein
MIKPISKSLLVSTLKKIEVNNILYAEVTPTGAMGNSGGIIIYLRDRTNKEIVRYETNIDDNEEAYLLAGEILFKYSDNENTNSDNVNLYFDYYYGGMGNNVFINKKIKLSLHEKYFIYKEAESEYQITSSVPSVFFSVNDQINTKKSIFNFITKRISPQWIEKLEDNEIFVFGSNLNGLHGGGASALARKWGAIWGQGVGLQGKTYAIPTMQGQVDTVKPFVDDFLIFAKSNPHLKFLVTEIGCGIAGFKIEQIAPLFKRSIDENIENVFLPNSFYNVLLNE